MVGDLLRKHYKTGRSGLPGNDDAGAMTSWYVWSSMGLFPNAGQDYYYVGVPLFARSQIRLGNNREFVIEARRTSAQDQYIQSATLNGKSLARAFLYHSELVGGGILVLQLGPRPSPWGSNERPPSVERALR